MSETLCCRQYHSQDAEFLSPFQRVIALGYYDGETSGFAQCHQCGDWYVFELIDWDSGQDLRVFQVDRIGGQAGAQLESLFAEHQTGIHLVGPNENIEIDSSATNSASPFVVLVANTMCGTIRRWRLVDSHPTLDWFAEFGLER